MPAPPPPTDPVAVDPAPIAAARAAWNALGTGGAVVVDAVEVHLVNLHFRTPVRTSRGVHRRRPVVLVRVIGSDDRGAVEGWGECAALADTTYDAEDASTAFATLADVLVPALLAEAGGAGTLPGVAAVRASAGALFPRVGGGTATPLAVAALEMAVADAHLRAAREPLAGCLAVPASTVPVGAVAGRHADVAELVDEVSVLVAAGYPRVKLKIGPGWDVGPTTIVTREFPGLVVQVDANESYVATDPAHLAALDELDGLGLACIEQPFARDELAAHARLVAGLHTPVCLDEGVGSPYEVEQALGLGACTAVCVKPARLGGIGAALDVVASASGAGVPLWMGGMFESTLARSVNATLAGLPGFAWPGDLAAPASYLVGDSVPGQALWAERGADGVLRTQLSRAPGVGPRPRPVSPARTVRLARPGH